MGTISALFNLVRAYFNFARAGKEHALDVATVKDKKSLKKATDIAEQIFDLMDKYVPLYEKSDIKKYEKLKKQFKKVN